MAFYSSGYTAFWFGSVRQGPGARDVLPTCVSPLCVSYPGPHTALCPNPARDCVWLSLCLRGDLIRYTESTDGDLGRSNLSGPGVSEPQFAYRGLGEVVKLEADCAD